MRWPRASCSSEDTQKVLPEVKAANMDKMTMAEYVAALKELTAAELEQHSANYGFQVITVLQEANDTLFARAGWMFSTLAMQGPLLYSARKSWIFKSTEDRASYETVQGLWALQGTNISKRAIAPEAMEG